MSNTKFDAETLYEVPLMLDEEGLDQLVCKRAKFNMSGA